MKAARLYSIILVFALTMGTLLLATNLDEATARTPAVNGAIPKPPGFLIHLPWKSGSSGEVSYTSYFESDNHIQGHSYAIDFDLGGGEVHPIASGTVFFKELKDKRTDGDYGNLIFIRHTHPYDDYVSVYAHLASFAKDFQQNDPVTIDTSLGLEGSTYNQKTRHLHFALMYCPDVMEAVDNGTSAPGFIDEHECAAVVPEPFLGEEVYEGLLWWRHLSKDTPLVALTRPEGDTTSPTGNWGENATPDGAVVKYGTPIIFDVSYSDADMFGGEIRLTAGYPDWKDDSKNLPLWNSDEVWRIIARCKPGVGTDCSQEALKLFWYPHEQEAGIPIENGPGLLSVPWLPKAKPAAPPPNSAEPLQLCISFDLFDRAGNAAYAPGDIRCNSVPMARDSISAVAGNETRLITVLPLSQSYESPDAALFVRDVTIPDGFVASSGQTLNKTWLVRNTGSTQWGNGYQLAFVNGDQMGGPAAVSIPVTGLGQEANITVGLIAPDSPGRYKGYWQLRNSQGTYFGPKMWVDVTVPGSNIVTTNYELTCLDCPATVPPGYQFRPTLRVKIGDGQLLPSRGDMVRHAGGELFGAWPHVAATQAASSGETMDFTFYADNPITAPDTPGVYESIWRLWQNGEWAGPEYKIRFEVKSESVNRPPNAPALTGPGDWAVYTGNGNIQLSAQHQGDPDGDNITHYEFSIFESAQTPSSGAITNNSWSPQGLGYNGYQWHARVRDSRGAWSDWSNTWHFNVLNDEPEIYDFHYETCRNSWGGPELLCFCAQTNAGTLRLQVNSATDGSASGEWQVLNELGTPNYNCQADTDSPPTWNHLEYESGTHLVRLYARREGGWTNAAYQDLHISLASQRRPGPPFGLLPAHDSYVDSRTVMFDWRDTYRTTSYQLQASTDPTFSTLILDETLPVGTSEYTHTFDADHETVFWRTIANGPYGTNDSTQQFHIDLTPPESTIGVLPAITTETNFSVNWGGSDIRSGVRWYHIQVRDGDRPGAEWVDWLVNTTKTAEIFQGQAGHSYFFRSRAMDEIGNWEPWPPGEGDTSTLVDPSAIPAESWWNQDYAWKHNLVILNNDTDALPAHFPMHIHLDGSTTPTAADVYNASLASTKGNDVRIVYQDELELNRFVTRFSSTAIDIWFPLQASINGGGTDSTNYQIYYGNSTSGNPPANTNSVFLPEADANTVLLAHFQEGSGSFVADTSGRGHNGTFVGSGWADGYLGRAGLFNGSTSDARFGSHRDFNLGAMTIEGWILVSKQTGFYEHVFNKETYWLRLTGSRQPHAKIFGNEVGGSCPNLELNKWYHIAVTYDGSNRARIFLNGQKCSEKIESHTPHHTSTDFRVGNAYSWENTNFPGQIQHVRVSNVERTSFPYARVDIKPSTALGVARSRPIAGDPDLVLLDLQTFPDTEGGLIVEAVVKNIGTRDTQNGFSTDLYVNHLPTGAQDYTGSISFWVNDKIEPNETVILTTNLDNSLMMSQSRSLHQTGPTETSGIFFAQVDSSGVVTEVDDGNNVHAEGVDFCMAEVDPFEDDDTAANAKDLVLDQSQTHNFNKLGDQDWVKFDAEAGIHYQLSTSGLGTSSDTVVYLYDTDGTTLLAANDDDDGTLASSIVWQAPSSGTYYAVVKHWNPNAGGCGTVYDLRLSHAMVSPWSLDIVSTSATDIALAWEAPASNCTYALYESVAPYFTPETALVVSAASPHILTGKLGDVDTNYFYIARATCSEGTLDSLGVGEFDFAIVTAASPPGSSGGTELLDAAWHLQGNNGASEAYQDIAPNVLQGKGTLQITVDLHGLTPLGGDASALILDQDGWRFVSLSDYVEPGVEGAQVVDIPLADFPGLDLNQPVGTLHARFWYGGPFEVDILSIVAFD